MSCSGRQLQMATPPSRTGMLRSKFEELSRRLLAGGSLLSSAELTLSALCNSRLFRSMYDDQKRCSSRLTVSSVCPLLTAVSKREWAGAWNHRPMDIRGARRYCPIRVLPVIWRCRWGSTGKVLTPKGLPDAEIIREEGKKLKRRNRRRKSGHYA